ncbi:hypothetical protein cypCar_00026065 [Cyprinus carpio]|nr:hypothetical protein cypCar_00026065 [Cyprinus carpio]
MLARYCARSLSSAMVQRECARAYKNEKVRRLQEAVVSCAGQSMPELVLLCWKRKVLPFVLLQVTQDPKMPRSQRPVLLRMR